MKYLKLFETEAGYASYKNGSDYVLPNVSYVEENDTVFYESEEEFTEDELLYYHNGTSTGYIINLTTLKVKNDDTPGVEEDVNIDENGNIVVDVDKKIPGREGTGSRIMYWTSESVNEIPMNFEYTLYDGYEINVLSGEYNEMVTLISNGIFNEPQTITDIRINANLVATSTSILEIKSKISNKTHRILFQ